MDKVNDFFCANIKIMGKPRMTQRDKWAKRKCVVEYFKIKDILISEAKKQNFKLGSNIEISLVFSMPESWSKKKRKEMVCTPHQNKPDMDNALKAIFDSLHPKDQEIYGLKFIKTWGNEDYIYIKNRKD